MKGGYQIERVRDVTKASSPCKDDFFLSIGGTSKGLTDPRAGGGGGQAAHLPAPFGCATGIFIANKIFWGINFFSRKKLDSFSTTVLRNYAYLGIFLQHLFCGCPCDGKNIASY